MPYLDSFIAAVPTEKKDAYLAHVRDFWPLMKAHGAIAICENWGDDVPDGELTSFPLAVKCEAGETVVVSFTVWPDKETRNAAWKAMENDPEMMASMQEMPFDGKRLIYGGFAPIFMDGSFPGSQ